MTFRVLTWGSKAIDLVGIEGIGCAAPLADATHATSTCVDPGSMITAPTHGLVAEYRVWSSMRARVWGCAAPPTSDLPPPPSLHLAGQSAEQQSDTRGWGGTAHLQAQSQPREGVAARGRNTMETAAWPLQGLVHGGMWHEKHNETAHLRVVKSVFAKAKQLKKKVMREEMASALCKQTE